MKSSGRSPRSLLEILQDIIERTYDMDTRITDIGGFVVGDEGFRRLIAGRRVIHRVEGRLGEEGPAVLIRQEGGRVQASLYYPDWLIRRLEDRSPLLRLDEANLGLFFLFVEELDHLLFLADRVRLRRPVSLLELEFHANVTKDLVTRLFLARQTAEGRLSEEEREWVRYHLYGENEFLGSDPFVRSRYAEAARYAYLYLRKLEAIPAGDRLPELRRFHRRDWGEQLRFLVS